MKFLKYGLGALAANVMLTSAAAAQELAVTTGGSEILSAKAVAALAMGIAAAGGAAGQGKAIASAVESISRNPGAAGSMFLPWLLALIFIESLVILTFLTGLLIG